MKKLKLGHILGLLILLNWGLLIFYFIYQTQDQEFNMSETKVLFNFFNRNIESEIIDEEEENAEEELGEELEDIKNFDQFPLYDDVNGTLQTIGDDDVESSYDYTIQAIREINPIKDIFISYNEPIRKQTQLNLLKDNHYCDLNNLYIVTHPNFPINIITDYPTDSPIAQALDMAGVDVLPNVQLDSSKLYHLPYQATIFFMENLNFHKYFEIGTQLLCNFQAYNHIPGIEVLFKKSQLVEILQNSNVPQPQTFVMNNKTQCQDFFQQQLNESQYIVKDHIKRFVTQQSLDTNKIKRKYQGGEMCGIIFDDLIIQKKVENRSQRFFAILFISLVDPIQFQIYDGFYYKIQKGIPTDHQRYNETISSIVAHQVEQFIHNLDLVQDNRFYSLLRLEFIESDTIYLISVNPNIDRDLKVQDYMTSLIVSSLRLVNFQQQQRLQLMEHHQLNNI